MVFLNKHLLSNVSVSSIYCCLWQFCALLPAICAIFAAHNDGLLTMQLDAPMFVTWFQCVVAVLACYALGNLRETHPAMKMFPTFDIKLDVAKQVSRYIE